MAAPTVGYAVMPVVPSLRGMDAELRRQLNGPAERAGREAGKKAAQGWKQSFGELNIDASSLTDFGTKAVAVGGLVAFGLGKAGKAAGDLSAAVATSAQIFGGAAGEIEDWSQSSAEGFGLSQRAALEAAAGFAAFGKSAGLQGAELTSFSTSLTELAADLAAMKNTSVEDALTALQSGLAGEQEPLRRYQVLLSDAQLRQKAFELGIIDTTNNALTPQQRVLAAHAVIMQQTADAQGQFTREQDELGTSMAVARAQFEDASAALGEALLPLMTSAAQTAAGLAEGFSNLNPETQSLVGRLAAVGAAGTVMVGGLSLAAGAGMKLHDAYGRMSTAAANGNRVMALTATTARGAAKAIGAAGMAFAVYELAGALNRGTRDAVAFETAVANIATAASQVDIGAALAEAAGTREGVGDEVFDFFDRVTALGARTPSVKFGEFVVEIDNLERALADMKAQDPKAFADSIAYLQENMSLVDSWGLGADSKKDFEDLQRLLGEYEENLQATGAAQEQAAGDGSELGAAMEKQADAAEASKKASDALSSATNRLSARQAMLSFAFDSSRVAAQSYLNAIERSTSADNLLRAGLGAGTALRNLREGVLGEADAAKEAKDQTDTLADAIDNLNDTLNFTDPALSRTEIMMGRLSAAADAFRNSLAGSSRFGQQLSAALDVGESFIDFSRTARRLPAELDLAGAATGRYRTRQREAIRDVLELGDSTREYLGTLLEMGRSTTEVRREADRLRDAYARQLRSVGMTEEQVRKYIDVLGLTPSQVDTAIRVSGVEAARFEIQSYLQLLEGRIPENIAAAVTAQISAGNLEAAADQLAALAASNPVKIPVETDSESIEETKQDLLELPRSIDFAKAALGGYTEAQERGLEAALALGDATKTYLSEVLASDGPQKATAEADRLREAYRRQFAELGIVGEAFEEYEDKILGLDQHDVEVAIRTAGFEQTVFEIETLLSLVDSELSDEQKLEIAALINTGQYDRARLLLAADIVEMEKNPVEIPVELDTRPFGNFFTTGVIGSLIPGGESWKVPVDVDPTVLDRSIANIRAGMEGEQSDIPVGADTTVANRFIDELHGDIAQRRDKPVGANTGIAESYINRFQRDYLNPQRDMKIGADLSAATRAVKQWSSMVGVGLGVVGSMFTWEPRALGGPVQAQQAYLVGEKGPELFIPDSNGTIVPNDQFDAIGSTPRAVTPAAAGGGTGEYWHVEHFHMETPQSERAADDLFVRGPALLRAKVPFGSEGR